MILLLIVLVLVIMMSTGCIGNEAETETETGIGTTETEMETETEEKKAEVATLEKTTEAGGLTETGIKIVDLGTITTEKERKEIGDKILFDPKGSEAVLYRVIVFDVERIILSIDRDDDTLKGEGVTFIAYGNTYIAKSEYGNIYVFDADKNRVMVNTVNKSGCNTQLHLL